VSALQAPQVFEAEQTGFASGQSALVTHSTQAPLVAQAGVAGVSFMQLLPVGAAPQPTHMPAGEQNGVVGVAEQSASFPHWTQAPLAPQTGFALFRSPHVEVMCVSSHRTQVFAGPQKGVVDVAAQSLSVSHATQAPLAAQTGFPLSRA
jgi:hypothetical protein